MCVGLRPRSRCSRAVGALHLPTRCRHVVVWRSVRVGGDTNQEISADTRPERCIQALRRQRAQQATDRLSAGERWHETGLVIPIASVLARPPCKARSQEGHSTTRARAFTLRLTVTRLLVVLAWLPSLGCGVSRMCPGTRATHYEGVV